MNAMSKYRGTTAVQRAFDGRRRLRGWRNNHYGGLQAAKCHPLSMCRFRPDEGGTVSTALSVKLAPVSGYMRSKAYVDVVQIFVPYQAIEKHILYNQADGGVTEMAKRRLMEGQGLGLGPSNPISKACNIHPKMVGGSERVSSTIDSAYNVAVNHLRRSAYHAADQVGTNTWDILPAVLTANVLERFNGVLDPERHIDGAINLTGELPVKGIGKRTATFAGAQTVKETGESGDTTFASAQAIAAASGASVDEYFYIEEDPDNPGHPNITVDLDGTSEITLRDMVESQKLDGLIRKFAKMIKDNPENGEEQVERAIYGLTVDFDSNCQVMYRKVHELTAMHQRPTDGASINDISAHFELNTRFSTLVPRSELGGQLVTIVMVKPLETLAAQPDPSQTETWEVVNRIHDETELDEQLLKRSDLESGVSVADEDAPAFWVGHNQLKHNYNTHGPNAQQTSGVQMKSSMWTYEVPTSVTPANVSYPAAGINMYPFFNWNGAHAEYTVDQVAAISTPLAKGPNPVEKIQLFATNPGLVDGEA